METTSFGLIHWFRHENGFGVLELEDGREVHFDVSVCVEEPLEGQTVRVVLGPDKAGGARAVLVEPASLPESTRPATTLREAVRRLQSEGIALELDEYELEKLARALGIAALTPDELGSLLVAYYDDPLVAERRRQSDLFVVWREGESFAAFEKTLATTLGGQSVVFDSAEINVGSVDDIVDAFNEELRAAGDTRRFVPLELSGSARAYFCMALARAMRLSVMGVLRVRWERPHLTPSEPPPRNA